MPIDLVIDERDTKPGDLGDNNNNSSSNGSGGPGPGMGGASNGGRGGSADPGHHSDSASTPDHQVNYLYYYYCYYHYSITQTAYYHSYYCILMIALNVCLNQNDDYWIRWTLKWIRITWKGVYEWLYFNLWIDTVNSTWMFDCKNIEITYVCSF